MATPTLTAPQALARLERGDALRMELGDGGARLYWFEAPLAYVSEQVVDAIAGGPVPRARLVEALDSLFGLPLNSQTYLAARGGVH